MGLEHFLSEHQFCRQDVDFIDKLNKEYSPKLVDFYRKMETHCMTFLTGSYLMKKNQEAEFPYKKAYKDIFDISQTLVRISDSRKLVEDLGSLLMKVKGSIGDLGRFSNSIIEFSNYFLRVNGKIYQVVEKRMPQYQSWCQQTIPAELGLQSVYSMLTGHLHRASEAMAEGNLLDAEMHLEVIGHYRGKPEISFEFFVEYGDDVDELAAYIREVKI